MSDHSIKHHPRELRYISADKRLEIDFEDGRTYSLPAEYLRVESPSAEVQKKIIGGRRHVGIMAIDPVGSYAVRLKFDDLHDTGLYTWDYLYQLGSTQEELWRRYLENLAAQGLSRDP